MKMNIKRAGRMLALFCKGERVMVLETKNKKVDLIYRTRSIVRVNKELNGKNFEELYFNAVSENNVEALSKIILVFAEDVNSGLSAFKNIDEVFDFLDEYMEEKSGCYQDIFKGIAKSINEMGFFNSKMSAEELEAKMRTHMSIDMNEIIKSSAEKAIAGVAEKEFRGYKG